MSLMYWRVKDFVVDALSTFFRFIFELTLITSHILIEGYYMIKKIVKELIIPNIIHFLHDVNHILYVSLGGFCWFLSTLSLKISKYLLDLSDKLMRKSEEITHKTWSI